MKFASSTAALAVAIDRASAFVAGHPSLERSAAVALADLEIRAEPANQPNGYTPTIAACPANPPTIRTANSLSPQESSWLQTRRPNTLGPMSDFLTRVNITGFDAAGYINNNRNNISALPNIGIAASGGGYRAMLNGAGALAAFDSRTDNANATGHLGGLLQSATYLAGLSGGSWLVGSLYGNNVTTVESIINGQDGDLWDFTNSILKGPDSGSIQILDSASYYHDLYDQVEGKSGEGFNTTLTDYWGRALSYQLINADNGGPAYTWSSIANQDFFTSASVPMPIIIADGRAPGEVDIADNTTIFEFNPWEFGTWDRTVYAFAPMEYVGTNFSNGAVVDPQRCVTGYDNIGYVYGTSSTLFNQIVLQFNTTVSLPSFIENAIQDALNHFGESDNDIASWVNPFLGVHPATNKGADSVELTLVDGGEDGENIPLHPLIQPVRNVDVIFAIDSSADTTYNWPNGTSLVATYQRSQSTFANGTLFPEVPSQNTFVNLGLNSRPTFFGCNSTSSTAPGQHIPPLIVYLPNHPYSFMSNVSTYDLSYTDGDRDAIITNGFNAATMGNATSNYDTCIGCAILQRSLVRTGTAIPAVCNTCFTDYCWNGQTNDTTPANYAPTYALSGAGNATATSSACGSVAPSKVRTGVVAAVAGIALWLSVA